MTQKVSDEMLGRFARRQNDWFARVRAALLILMKSASGAGNHQPWSDPHPPLRGRGDRHRRDRRNGDDCRGQEGLRWLSRPDFESCGTNQSSGPTKAQQVAVHEMQQDARFAEMFVSLGDLDALCLTQSQIIRFCRDHRDKLRQSGYATFFLFKTNTDKGRSTSSPTSAWMVASSGRTSTASATRTSGAPSTAVGWSSPPSLWLRRQVATVAALGPSDPQNHCGCWSEGLFSKE